MVGGGVVYETLNIIWHLILLKDLAAAGENKDTLFLISTPLFLTPYPSSLAATPEAILCDGEPQGLHEGGHFGLAVHQF